MKSIFISYFYNNNGQAGYGHTILSYNKKKIRNANHLHSIISKRIIQICKKSRIVLKEKEFVIISINNISGLFK
jgi:hypothetical protein